MPTRRRKTFANLLIARFTAVITVRFIANHTFVTFLFVCKIIFFIRLVYFFFLCFASSFLQGRKLSIFSDEMFSFLFFSDLSSSNKFIFRLRLAIYNCSFRFVFLSWPAKVLIFLQFLLVPFVQRYFQIYSCSLSFWH